MWELEGSAGGFSKALLLLSENQLLRAQIKLLRERKVQSCKQFFFLLGGAGQVLGKIRDWLDLIDKLIRTLEL